LYWSLAVAPTPKRPQGWFINERGEILASAVFASGEDRVVLLVPLHPPSDE
jgi:hypothetical protein